MDDQYSGQQQPLPQGANDPQPPPPDPRDRIGPADPAAPDPHSQGGWPQQPPPPQAGWPQQPPPYQGSWPQQQPYAGQQPGAQGQYDWPPQPPAHKPSGAAKRNPVVYLAPLGLIGLVIVTATALWAAGVFGSSSKHQVARADLRGNGVAPRVAMHCISGLPGLIPEWQGGGRVFVGSSGAIDINGPNNLVFFAHYFPHGYRAAYKDAAGVNTDGGSVAYDPRIRALSGSGNSKYLAAAGYEINELEGTIRQPLLNHVVSCLAAGRPDAALVSSPGGNAAKPATPGIGPPAST